MLSGIMHLLIGLPGSGKTEVAKNYMDTQRKAGVPCYRVSWDDLRKEMGLTGHWSRKAEEAMIQESYRRVRLSHSVGVRSFIIDNTNLNANTRARWAQLAAELNLEVQEIRVQTDLADCIQRDSFRKGSARVGRAVIERMALMNDLIHFPKTDSRLPNIVLVDIDGTIARNTERVEKLQKECPGCFGTCIKPEGDKLQECLVCNGKGKTKKNWFAFYSNVLADRPVLPIIRLVRELQRLGYIICIVSGRPINFAHIEVGKQTEDWLKLWGVDYDHLFMRNGGDSREDAIVKKEILDKIPFDSIAYVLDDRNSVVKMWREAGLTCLQVAEGDF